MTLDQYISWFKAHERFLLVGVVLATGAWGYTRWLDKSATDAKLNAAVAAQVAQQADASKKQADAAQAQMLAQANAQTTLLASQIADDKRTIASLVSAIASRDAATSNKVTTVKSATPVQAVADFNDAYGSTATLSSDGSVSVPAQAVTAATVAKLEGDTAKADLKDTQTELASAQAEVTNAEGIIVEKDKVIAQDAVTLAAHDADAKAQQTKAADDLKSAKAQSRKSKWKIFWIGFASGWLGHEIAQAHGL